MSEWDESDWEQPARKDQRSSARTPFNAKVKITHDQSGEYFYHTRDISDTGVFVVVDSDQNFPGLGSVVRVQMVGLPIPAPVKQMIVVRKGPDGYGLHFAGDEGEIDEDK